MATKGWRRTMFLYVRRVPCTAQARMWRASVAVQNQTSASSTGTGACGLAPASELSGSVAAFSQSFSVFGFFFFEAEGSEGE
eukprot:3775061-Pyramimonas_sp.AAC.1